MILTDHLGNNYTFLKAPKRIVSLVPSLTETLFDLGLEDEIVGITKFCVHPMHLKATKTVVGGTKNVKFEVIDALQPDIIIANKEENTPEIVEELQKKYPVWVTDIVKYDNVLRTIEEFGILFNKRTNAKKWLDKIAFAHQEFYDFIKDKASKKVAYFIWANPYMAVAEKTFIHEMLVLNRFENIYANNEKYEGRYPEVIIQKMKIQGDLDIVFLSSEPFPFKDEHAFEIGRYTHHAKTIFVDGEMFSWYGTRILKAFNYFKTLHERI